MIKRTALVKITSWKDDQKRKPLLIRGARQVGKSYLIREHVSKLFDGYVELNLEKQPELSRCFEGTLGAKEILSNLQVISGRTIDQSTLLFLDEIQVQPRAIQALRYLYEETPEIPVIAAGSLLEFGIKEVGLPVGRVSSLALSPVTFEEFLEYSGNGQFLDLLNSHDLRTPLHDAIHEKGNSLLQTYLAVGGMPEVCRDYVSNNNLLRCQELQSELLTTYRDDFPKYVHRHSDLQRVSAVFERVPNLVGKVVKYVEISREHQARELRSALDALHLADVIHKVYKSSGDPLGALVDHSRYKLIFLDVGLMQRACGMSLKNWVHDPTSFIHSGSIAEQFVGQQLHAYRTLPNDSLFYWERAKSSSSAEIDYLVQKEGAVIPIEVKSGAHGRLRSMAVYLDQFSDTPYGIKTSLDNFQWKSKIRSVPLYAFGTWLAREES
jgi:uncharacterized protein